MYSTCMFDAEAVKKAVDLSAYAQCEIPAEECKLRQLILTRVGKESQVRSFQVKLRDEEDEEEEDWQPAERRTQVSAGLGLFDVEPFKVWYGAVGAPCGTDCGVDQLRSVVVFCPIAKGGLDAIRAWCEELVEEAEKSDPRRFSIYRWHLRHRYWNLDSRAPVRPLESIVLPATTKAKIVDDLTEFLSPSTKAFYLRHGIPYRRSYLFYGSPGAGKSSTIVGLASAFGRNVCYLQLCDEHMSDDALRDAIHAVPSRSIVVLEDIDSLFDKHRTKKNNTPLTFSGLLNALDGIGTASGQLFVMTTNERHNLDEALVRHGRVDLSVEFAAALPEQATTMFRNFYPDSPDAHRFATNLFDALGQRPLSTAALQAYFVAFRHRDAAAARDGVATLIADLDERAASRPPPKRTNLGSNDDDEDCDEEEDVEASDEAATGITLPLMATAFFFIALRRLLAPAGTSLY